MTKIIQHLTEISSNYSTIFCDLWGCLHNGITPFSEAVLALEAFRDLGKTILLLTNSPRQSSSVDHQLSQIGVPRDLYHGIVSSGDAARAAMATGTYGKRVYHIGSPSDVSFFSDLEKEDFYQNINIERVDIDDAESIICTGLFDDTTETPKDYRALFLAAKNRKMKLLCANPDIFVDRGDMRIFCAGALAKLYTEMGGVSHYFGKPHSPIYTLAYQRLTTISGQIIDPKQILCIGDGIHTDIKGALGEELDSLFITGGIAAKETATDIQPDENKLSKFLHDMQMAPDFSIGYLR